MLKKSIQTMAMSKLSKYFAALPPSMRANTFIYFISKVNWDGLFDNTDAVVF
jgi:hypothetical protein